MRAADLVVASLLMLVGGVVVADALRLGTGWGTDGPRSGFFPFWLAVIMLASCLAIFVQAWRRTTTKPFVTSKQLAPVLKVILPALVLAFVMDPPGDAVPGLGLYVASALYIGFYMRWIGRHGWPLVVVVAAGIPIVTFFVFETWFLVPMPKGPLEDWLGY